MTILTQKLQGIYHDLYKKIIYNYDKDYLEYIFSGNVSINDVIFQILVECCRYAYINNLEKHPWTYYINEDDLELELKRKELKRTLSKVNKNFEIREEILKQKYGLDLRKPNHELVKENGKYPYYETSKFQYWELNNIHDMKIIWAIADDRISSTKKISNDKFIEMANEYDSIVLKYIEKANNSKEDYIFSSLVLFSLQTKYSIDFFYKIADTMENHDINEIPDLLFRLYATTQNDIKYQTRLSRINPNLINDKDCQIDYPMIIQRERLLNDTIFEPKSSAVDLEFSVLIEANILANSVQNHTIWGKNPNINIREWFARNTNIDDWFVVFKNYNVFRTFEPYKKWTNKKIKYVRNFILPTHNKKS